jgi:hypothetical protein
MLDYERQPRRDRKEGRNPRQPSGAVPFKSLRAPVGFRRGRHEANYDSDQIAVMGMLDNLRTDFGGNWRGDGTFETVWPLPIEGKCHVILGAMILRVQNAFHTRGQLGFWPDGAIDPGGRTHNLIKQYSGHIPVFPATSPKELALEVVPLALKRAQGAGNYLDRYKAWRSAGSVFSFDAVAANTHLHLDQYSGMLAVVRINEWQENYRMIAATLRAGERIFVRASREEALAARNTFNPPCWGDLIPAWATPQGGMWFGPDFLGLGPKCRAAILLHEAGHYIKAKIGHQGGESGSEYDSQSTDQALTSAYVCANFATHAETGRDERFGLARPNE